MSDKWIQASEIGQYVYCNRAWWLRRIHGHQSAHVRELAAGQAYHEAHGRIVRRSQLARRLALTLVFLAVVVTSYWLVVNGL